MYNRETSQMKKNNIKIMQTKASTISKVVLIIVSIIIMPSITASQSLNYSCKSNAKQKVTLRVTSSTNFIENSSDRAIVYKYVLNIGNKLVKVFFLYSHQNKLHILEKEPTKINPADDQVIFSKPKLNIYAIHTPGLFSNAHLVLLSHATINDHSFYKYEVNTDLHENFISEVMFDNNLHLDELKIKLKNTECRCTKSNINIPLLQK